VKAGLLRRATELGFAACRVDRAGPADHRAEFRAWLAAGCHGTMAYLERTADRRVDPCQVLPGARSVVILAVAYPGVDSPPAVGPDRGPAGAPGTRGVVARYARYADYHDLLVPRLQALAEWINGQGGAGTHSLPYVDAGPVLERDFAQRAGMGFVGKHTNLIHRRLGNWFFLCEIITTAEFEPDPPEPNRCGTCTRCITACPTGAITAPFHLDARRCISYLTIELKGSIPEDLRPAIGGRIFGCDDCLAACPWNRFARESSWLAEHRRAEAEAPLTDLLALDDATFRQRFAGTPILRSKRRGLLRNVCVALGNVGGPEALPALQRAAQDPEPLVVEHATWAIARIGVRRACGAGEASGDGSATGRIRIPGA